MNQLKEYPFVGGLFQYHKLEKNNNEIGNVSNIYNKDLELCNSINCKYSINGGLSFRKKSAMIECIQKIDINKIVEERKNLINIYFTIYKDMISEDVYFQNALDILGYKLPSKEICLEFCTNLSYSNHYALTSYAVHGFNKYGNDVLKVFIMRPSIEQLYREIKKNPCVHHIL